MSMSINDLATLAEKYGLVVDGDEIERQPLINLTRFAELLLRAKLRQKARDVLPGARYLAFDGDGDRWAYTERPIPSELNPFWYATSGKDNLFEEGVRPCPNWRETLIDLESDDV